MRLSSVCLIFNYRQFAPKLFYKTYKFIELIYFIYVPTLVFCALTAHTIISFLIR